MKHTQAVIACSLLGSLWLASCSSSTKKDVIPQGEAGAAGESAGGAGGESTAVGGEAGATVAGAGGESLGGQGGEGGAPPVCFNDLNELLAGAPGLEPGAGGAGSAIHAKYSCETVKALLSPTYDAANNSVKLDASLLGPAVSGDYTYYYDAFDGETSVFTCGEGLIQTTGTQLTLPVDASGVANGFLFTALKLTDGCGNDAELSTPSETSTDFCFNLRLRQGEGEAWFVDCEEGSCQPTCAEFND